MAAAPKERVLADVERELRQRLEEGGAVTLEVFKKFRKLEEHRLRIWHNAGGGGREIARQRSDLIDIFFRVLFEGVAGRHGIKISKEPLAVGAFGGYGRREMNPFSDVDIMFLHGGKQPGKVVSGAIRETLTYLWDLGFKVGHSSRSIAEAMAQANSDMVTKTAMLECRWLAGDKDLFSEFKKRFERACVTGRESQYIAWRLENSAELHQKYGASVFMQEPNVKYGCGGLRDYQSILWLAFFKERINSMAKLVDRKFLRDSERKSLDTAYDFLLRIRTELHYLNGRPFDSLTLQLQGRIANNFGYPQRHILGRCEALMRDYYSKTLEVYQTAKLVQERLSLVPENGNRGLFGMFAPRRPERFDRFVAREGKLYPESRDIFDDDPNRMMRAFHHLQLRKLNLSSELGDLISRRLGHVNRTFQYAKTNRETFLAILSRKGEVGRILRAMHACGFLGRYIPEFGALTCLVQHEFYHRYTADEHTLVCIEKLDSVLLTSDEKLSTYRDLFQKLEDPQILYLAVLLHDTGKAGNRRHHEEQSALLAQRVARRLQLHPDQRKSLILLVDAHYTLSQTARTRNLEDPATISEFAGIVQARPNLDALMLLTLADGMGTSDENWSDWKESLVWTLYRLTCSFLESGPRFFEQVRIDRQELREQVEKKLPKAMSDEIGAHFELMPERYFQTVNDDEAAAHIRLFREFIESQFSGDTDGLAPVVRWIPRVEQGHSEVWVCGWDREGLLADIAGAFLATQLNILSADAFTRYDNLAFDVFRVCTTNHAAVENKKDVARFQKCLTEAMRHMDFDFTPLIEKPRKLKFYRLSQDVELPTKIVLNNSSHPNYTLVEVQTPDRLGLLYELLRAMIGAGVNIELSRITTEMDVAMDTFYVTYRGGKVEDDDALRKLQRSLRKAATGDPGDALRPRVKRS